MVFENVFQASRQRYGLGEEEPLVLTEDRHHKDTLTVLRYAVFLGIEDLMITCVALAGQPFAPLAEVLGKLLLRESLDILHEQPLGMLGKDSVSTSPKQRRTCAAALREATLTASRRDVLAGKGVCEQVKIGNLLPINLHDVAKVGSRLAMNGTVGTYGVLVYLGDADHLELKFGAVSRETLQGDGLRPVTCKGFKDPDGIVAHVMMN